MNEHGNEAFAGDPTPPDRRMERQIGDKEQRMVRARNQRDQSIWFGLGMFGLVGWSIVIPTLLGIALGVWIDARWPSRFSWTIMLLVAGVAVGCLTAWRWVQRESEETTE